jgi:hypothetical protein
VFEARFSSRAVPASLQRYERRNGTSMPRAATAARQGAGVSSICGRRGITHAVIEAISMFDCQSAMVPAEEDE